MTLGNQEFYKNHRRGREIMLVFAVQYVHVEKIFRKVDRKHLESFEVWCWRRMEKIGWTDLVRSEEALQRI
jgi:hypothetical protein